MYEQVEELNGKEKAAHTMSCTRRSNHEMVNTQL